MIAALALAAGLTPAVHFDQRIGAQLPLQALELEPSNAPLVLVFGYAGCRNLCPTLVRGVAEALDQTGLAPGVAYRAVFVSIDPSDTDQRLAAFARDAVPAAQRGAWHFIRRDAATTHALMDAAGFVARPADGGQIAHGAGLVVASAQGRITQYLFGVRFDAVALRSALRRAARGETGSPITAFLLTCLHVDPAGRYGGTVLALLRLACLGFAAALGVWLLRSSWKRAS
jgi:protein SCO1/2